MTRPYGALLFACLTGACVSMSWGFAEYDTVAWPTKSRVRLRYYNSGFPDNLYGNVDTLGSLSLANSSGLLLELLNYLEEDIDSTCALHVKTLFDGYRDGQLWTLKAIDAWGRIPAEVLYGHLFELGNFDECLNMNHKIAIDHYIRGKYCLANVPMGKLLNYQQMASVFNLRIGICFPDSCSAHQIDLILRFLLTKAFNTTIDSETTLVQERNCSTRDKDSFEVIDIVAIVVLSLLGTLIIACTCYDYLATQLGKPVNPMLGAFSIRINCRQLFRISSHRNTPHEISCLNGIRCLSIISIILGHCYMFTMLMPLKNPIDTRSPGFFLYLQTGVFSVESFFFMSGLLLSTATMRMMDRSGGKINIPMMYIHRYLRLTSVLGVSLLMYMSLFRYMGSGPLWKDFVQDYKLCEKTWWTTLLYVQNYFGEEKMCMGHTWYLAVDMQLYVVSPLALIAIWKWKRKGVIGFLAIGLFLLVCQFTTIVVKEANVLMICSNVPNEMDFNSFYYPTYMRTSVWIIGVVFGYFLHTRSGRRTTLPTIYVTIGWVVAVGMVFSVIFALYPKTQPGSPPLTHLGGAFYFCFSRVAWALALSWIVFACVNGYGGFVNQFLSWKFWQPFSKLSYSIYICHVLVLMANAGRIKTEIYFSDLDVILCFCCDLGITIVVSIFMYLAIEAPFTLLQNHLFTPKKKIS